MVKRLKAEVKEEMRKSFRDCYEHASINNADGVKACTGYGLALLDIAHEHPEWFEEVDERSIEKSPKDV